MSKCDSLHAFLCGKSDVINLSVSEIERIVPGGLPRSARDWPAWWSNGDKTHSQSSSWGRAGYQAYPDIVRQMVRFVPTRQ